MVEKTVEPPPRDERSFVENMKRAREDRGWTQTELARRMVEAGWGSYTQMTVSRTEKFERPLRLGEARTLAEIFESRLEEMILPTDFKKEMDEFQAAIDSVHLSHDQISEAVKLCLSNKQVLNLLTLRVQGLESDSPTSAALRDGLLSVAHEVAQIPIEKVVEKALLEQQLEDGFYPQGSVDGEHSEKG